MKVAPDRIETARLIGTRYRDADEADVIALNSDLEVMRYIDAGGRSVEKVRAIFARLDAQWSLHGYGYWVLRERDGSFAGGLVLIRDNATGDVEAGYALPKHLWGKGMASEAMGALVTVAFATLELPSLFARVQPDNVPSVKVLLKHGFTFEREGDDDKGVHLHYFRRNRDGSLLHDQPGPHRDPAVEL